MSQDGVRGPIVVALIGLVSVLGAAAVGNWDRLFPPAAPTPAPAAEAPARIPAAGSAG